MDETVLEIYLGNHIYMHAHKAAQINSVKVEMAQMIDTSSSKQ